MSARRRPRFPRPVPAASLLGLLLAGGCVYLNALYNAEHLYEAAERARLEGRDSAASVRYDSVVAKAARGYDEEPRGAWADDALYLMGRAHLRRGDLTRARAALSSALEVTDDEKVRTGATLYLGAVAALEGDRTHALVLLNRALRDVESGTLEGEGHLWRARVNLASGLVDAGWWDLDRVGEADPRLAPAADLERVAWGVARDDSIRARLGVGRLLTASPSRVRTDTLVRLVGAASARWGPGPAAALLDRADEASLPPDARDRLLLLRAELRLRSGDTVAAERDAREVGAGFGAGAARARIFLARLVLARATTVEALDRARPLLLPAATEPGARELLEAVRAVELLVERGASRDASVALFAAGEVARDVLGADALARELFVAYADLAPGTPWAGKALLAALALGTGGPGEDLLRARLRAMTANPYVRALRTGWFPSAEYRRLEEELRAALDRVRSSVDAEVAELEVRLREKADTLR